MKVNPDGLVIYAKRILDRAGYYAIKKDRVTTLTATASISGVALFYSELSDYLQHVHGRMFRDLGHELAKAIPVRTISKAGDAQRYYASVDIILPRKD